MHDGQWFHFNDSSVRPATADAVAKCKPYILFYVRREFSIPPPLWRRFPDEKPRPGSASLDDDDDDGDDDVERTKENWANLLRSAANLEDERTKRKKEARDRRVAPRAPREMKIRPLIAYIHDCSLLPNRTILLEA